MASPAQIRDALLQNLRSTRRSFSSPDWLSGIRQASPSQKRAAADALMNVQLAILDLENAALGEFREQLLANEAALAVKLDAALADLRRVARVLNAVAGFLKMVARIVPAH